MYNGQTVSLKTILWSVLNNPLASDLTYERAAELAIEAIQLLGAPLALSDKVTNPPLEIINHKVALPLNLTTIRGARYVPDLLDYTSAKALTTASNIYHQSDACDENGNEVRAELTYTMQEGIMFTSFVDGYVQLSYKALPTDDDGYPLIPNEAKTKLAVEYYILYRFLEPLYIIGKITDKAFNHITQMKCFYMGGANTSLMLSGIDHLEAIGNSINRLIINSDAHREFFREASQKERLKRYN